MGLAEHALTGARAPRPTVAFLDAGRWESFDQLAARLRRAGCRCVRVTSAGSRVARGVSRLVYHEVIHLTTDQMAGWLASPRAEQMWDIHITDQVFAKLADRPDLVIPSRPSTPSLGWLRLVHDKQQQYEFFSGHGIAQPRQLVPEATTEEAIEELGSPLVVKRALGWGGYAVAVARTPEEAETVRADLAAAGPQEQVFFQQHIAGDEYGYGCTAVGGRVLQDACYRKIPSATRPLGQAVEIVTVSDPALLAAGRSVIEALGTTGLMGVDFMRDGRGTYRFIDLHPRPWGCFAALVHADVDLTQGYLHAIGVGERPVERPLIAGEALRSFPAAHHATLLHHGLGGGRLGSYLREARAYRRSISTRYWLESGCLTALHVGRRRPAARSATEAPMEDEPAAEPQRTRAT
jgi:hypothetical protein